MEDRKAYISRLLTEKLTGIITADDAKVIDELIETNAEVKNEWEQINAKIAAAVAAKKFSASETDAQAAWQKLRPVITPAIPVRKIPWRIISIAAAACMAGAVAIGYFLNIPKTAASNPFFAHAADLKADSILFTSDNGSVLNLTASAGKRVSDGNVWLTVTDSSLQIHKTPSGSAQWHTLLVPATYTYKVTLPDGSTVILNSGSRIKFPLAFTGNTREVFMEGEAYFDIAPDKQLPFIVHTAKTQVNVLGTQFNVNTYDSAHIQTSLVSGAVSTFSSLGTQLLKPGQASVYNDSSFTTMAFDASTTLSWLEGAYYFHDVPLQSLEGILKRWFNRDIAFDNPALKNKMLSGALLKNQPVQNFLDNLLLSDNIHSVVKNGVVHFQ